MALYFPRFSFSRRELASGMTVKSGKYLIIDEIRKEY